MRVEELEKQAPILSVDNDLRFETYLHSAKHLYLEAISQFEQRTKEPGSNIYRLNSLVYFLRFVNLITHTIPSHKDFGSLKAVGINAKEDSNISKNGVEFQYLEKKCLEALDYLKQLKKEVSEEVIPNITQHDKNHPSPETRINLHQNNEEAETSHNSPLQKSMNDYVLLAELGEGAFGSCSKMLDPRSNQICVVKSILFSSVKDVQSISNEIHILRKLSHPNIVSYYGTFIHNDRMCIVMEFCAEGDLNEWIVNRECSKFETTENTGKCTLNLDEKSPTYKPEELRGNTYTNLQSNVSLESSLSANDSSCKWKPVDEKIFFEWTQMICSAMSYLHGQSILHRGILFLYVSESVL